MLLWTLVTLVPAPSLSYSDWITRLRPMMTVVLLLLVVTALGGGT
jgi:succinate dehydrogenase hydrophobic anchor subunit